MKVVLAAHLHAEDVEVGFGVFDRIARHRTGERLIGDRPLIKLRLGDGIDHIAEQ